LKKEDYINLILEGYFHHKEHLSNFYYRKGREAEEKHITISEYYQLLLKANAVFFNEIIRLQTERVAEIALIKSTYKAQEIDGEEGLETPKIEQFGVHLPSFTRNKFYGNLYIDDLAKIYEAIKTAVSQIIIEIEGEDASAMLEKIAWKKSPFMKESDYKRFLHIAENWNYTQKNKWTYIYNYLSDTHKIVVPQRKYYGFIKDNYETVSLRSNEHVNNTVLIDIIKSIDESWQ
jgi:hypothetical protein